MIEKNPTVEFGNFLTDRAMKFSDGMFGKIMENVFETAMKFVKEHDDLIRSTQIRESQIYDQSKYIFSGRDRSRMTGLEEDDLKELRDHMEPFKRSFSKITIDEALTIFFVYARYVLFILIIFFI